MGALPRHCSALPELFAACSWHICTSCGSDGGELPPSFPTAAMRCQNRRGERSAQKKSGRCLLFSFFRGSARLHSAHLVLLHPFNVACMLGLHSREHRWVLVLSHCLEKLPKCKQADIITNFAIIIMTVSSRWRPPLRNEEEETGLQLQSSSYRGNWCPRSSEVLGTGR